MRMSKPPVLLDAVVGGDVQGAAHVRCAVQSSGGKFGSCISAPEAQVQDKISEEV